MAVRCGVMLVCWLMALSVSAQQMNIQNFKRLKRPLWKRSQVVVDKQMALFDLYTTEKGFTFVADGKTPIEAAEGEGLVTLKVPHKTRFITVKHADYGQLTWRAPGKPLKRKKHYQAMLDAYDPSKEYKVKQQWVVFNLSPTNVVLTVDSTLTRLENTGVVQRYLPVGKHTYRVEAPFYEAVEDSFLLTDSARQVLDIRLQPFYSYLTVKTPWPGANVYIDGVLAYNLETTSLRTTAGTHHVALYWWGDCYYETTVELGRAEKRVLEVPLNELYKRKRRVDDRVKLPSESAKEANAAKALVKDGAKQAFKAAGKLLGLPEAKPKAKQQPSGAVQADTIVTAPVTLTAADGETEIWVDRYQVGTGQWKGVLEQGFHLITTRKDGQESVPTYLWIDDDFPIEQKLSVPQTSYGLLNIHSNVTGAKVYVDSLLIGETPLISHRLPAGRQYTVWLMKDGYREAVKKHVQTKSNALVDVYMKMKRKKNKK